MFCLGTPRLVCVLASFLTGLCACVFAHFLGYIFSPFFRILLLYLFAAYRTKPPSPEAQQQRGEAHEEGRRRASRARARLSQQLGGVLPAEFRQRLVQTYGLGEPRTHIPLCLAHETFRRHRLIVSGGGRGRMQVYTRPR